MSSSSINRANYIKLVENRVLRNQASAVRSGDELERELNKAYKQAKTELMSQIMELRSKMSEWSMAEASRFDRLKKLLKNINLTIEGLGRDETSLTSSHLSELYEDRYLRTVYTLGQSVNVKLDLTLINKKAVQEAISYPWSGAMFSDRIWDNKELLVKNIREGLTQSLILGESMPKLANRINKSINTSNFNALRVARTEGMRVCYVADRKVYESEGIEKVRFCAYLDHRTSDKCRGEDGNVYLVGREPMLPLHPHCRSTYIPELPDIDYGDMVERKDKGSQLIEESDNFNDFKEKALNEVKLKDKYSGETGKEIAKNVQREYNVKQKAFFDDLTKYNDNLIERFKGMLESEGKFDLDDGEREKLLDVQRILAKSNDLLNNRDNRVFAFSKSSKKKVVYRENGSLNSLTYSIYEFDEYMERAGGKFYILHNQKLGKKEALQIEADIEEFLKVNPRAVGVRIRTDNKKLDDASKKSRGLTMGYYSPTDDAIVMRTYKGYEKAFDKVFNQKINGKKEFLETFTHELAHRVHSPNEAVSKITFKGDEWSNWKKLVEPFYEEYRINKKIDISREWHRFFYPVNAEDFYSNGSKENFYKEMWAESSSVLHTFGEGIDQEGEIAKLNKYFPNVKDFVEAIYKK